MIEARPPIYFVRHGVTDWNEERRIQGQIDTSLNARGHDQSKALAHALFGVVKPDGELRFCVSPLRRAKETMGYIAHCFAIEESRIEIEPRLQELGFGIWEGRLVKELKTHHDYPRDPALLYHWRPENGESYADGTARVSPWIDRLDSPTVIVSHGAIGRCILGLMTGLEREQLALMDMPQGRFCRLINRRIDWFDEAGGPA